MCRGQDQTPLCLYDFTLKYQIPTEIVLRVPSLVSYIIKDYFAEPNLSGSLQFDLPAHTFASEHPCVFLGEHICDSIFRSAFASEFLGDPVDIQEGSLGTLFESQVITQMKLMGSLTS